MTDRPTLPPEDDRDVTQLTGAFDRPVAPSPTFAERLKRQISDAQHEQGATDMHATAATEPRVSRMTDNRVIPMPPTRRSGGGVMEIVAAAVLVFALVSSGFYLYRIQNGTTPTEPEGQRLAATTPLASPTPVSDAGDTDDSETYPGTFEPTGEHEVVMLDNGLTRPIYAAVSGDTLVVSGNLPGADDPNEQGLMAIDLGSGEVLWTLDLAPWGSFVVEGGRIVGVFELPVETEYGMTAISLDSGRVEWTGEPLITYGGSGLAFTLPPYQTFRPILYNDAVYFAEPYGDITALNADTGELLWSLPVEQRIQRPGPHGGVSIDGEGEYLYAMDGERAVRKIDRHTGEIMQRFEVSDRDLSEFELELHVVDDLLVVIARSAAMGGSYGFIEALSTRTGEHLWTRDVGNPAPYIGITSEVVVVPYHILPDNLDDAPDDITEPGFYVGFLNRATGETVSLYNSSEPGFGTVSATDDVVCINEGTAIQCVDTMAADLTPETLPYAPGTESYAPMLFWNGSAVVLSIDDGITLLRPAGTGAATLEASPISSNVATAATPVATPQASPVTSDPNQTRAWPAGFEVSGPLVAQPIDGYPGYAASGMVVGDVLIAENNKLAVSDPPTFSGSGIYAQDLRSGEILWRNTDHINDRYTADESGVYILLQPMTNNQYLIALDLDTGEERWRSQPMSDFSTYPEDAPFLHANTPIAIDGTVYVPFVDGSVLAFDGESGEITWRYTPETIADIDDVHGNASITGTPDRIYAANGANVITMLDRESGEPVREIKVEAVPADYWLDLTSREGHLLVQASSMGSSDPDGMLIAIDPETGDEMWRQDTDVIVSNVLVSPTTVGVMHTDYDPANLIERVVLNEGLEGTTTLSLFDIDTGEEIDVPDGVFSPIDGVWSGALASSGETICVAYTTVTCFDVDGDVETVEGFETEEVSSPQALAFWNDRLVILDAREPIHIVAGP